MPGPDKCQGVKLLVLGPGHESPQNIEGYQVINIPTAAAFLGLRILNPEDVEDLSSQIRLYPFEERTNPPGQKLAFTEGKHFDIAQPRGFEYWERVNEVIQREPVYERDLFHMAMLRQVGIEKGKPFTPDEHQQKLLEEAAFVGEKMAIASAFNGYQRHEQARYPDDAHWKYVMTRDPPGQRMASSDQFEERASFAYEAIATAKGMVSKTPGVGSSYFSAFRTGWELVRWRQNLSSTRFPQSTCEEVLIGYNLQPGQPYFRPEQGKTGRDWFTVNGFGTKY